MHDKRFNYFSEFEPNVFAEKKQLITYSFNEKENSIIGSTVVINNFELNLDKYTKNLSFK